jgi:hypothetical protein
VESILNRVLGQGIGVVLSSVHALYLTLQIALRHSSVLEEEEEEEEVKDLGMSYSKLCTCEFGCFPRSADWNFFLRDF